MAYPGCNGILGLFGALERLTVKKPPSKDDIREELERETERFLRGGGQVQNVPQGLSGRDAGEPTLYLNRRLFVEPRGSRTLVPEVVAAIESRRKQKPARKSATRRRRKPEPRKKTIYDDFGEPLRRVWVDD